MFSTIISSSTGSVIVSSSASVVSIVCKFVVAVGMRPVTLVDEDTVGLEEAVVEPRATTDAAGDAKVYIAITDAHNAM